MKNYNRVYVIGPVSSKYQETETEKNFNLLIGRWKFEDNCPKAFVGSHYFQGAPEKERMHRKLRAIMDSDFIVMLPGTFRCKDAGNEKLVAVILQKEMEFASMIKFSEYSNTDPDSDDMLKKLWDERGYKRGTSDQPVMTNPMKGGRS